MRPEVLSRKQHKEAKYFNMNYLLLVFSCLCNGMKSVFAKKSNAYLNEKHNIYTYNFYMFFIAFLIALFVSISNLNIVSIQTIVMAVFYGLFLVFGQVFLIKAMDVGEVSVSTLFYSCGFLIPSFVSVFVYDEKLKLLQVVGIVLILVSFVISVEKFQKGKRIWFVFAVLSFLCNGMVGLMQKIFRMSNFGSEQNVFMVIAFFVGAVITFFIMPKKVKELPAKGFLKTVLGSGIMLGLVNVINVYVSGVLPGIIVFPSVNGGGIIVSAILARIFVKEKISFRKKAGIIIGVIAICLIAI